MPDGPQQVGCYEYGLQDIATGQVTWWGLKRFPWNEVDYPGYRAVARFVGPWVPVGGADPTGWYPFGTHVDVPGPLEWAGEELSEDGLPIWERPV